MLIPKEKINQAKELYGEQAMLDIVSYFGLEDSYNEKDKSCSCPWHRDKTPSFIWNPKNNSAHCFSCNRNFGIIDLYLAQGMSYLEAVEKLFNNVKFEYNFNNKNIQDSSYRYPKHEHSDRTNVEKYMGLRKISKKTLDYADVQSDCHGNVVFHYYNANDTLMTVKYRLGHKFDKEKDKSKCWAQSNADFTPLLFNMNRIDPSKPLVITEGECMKGDTEILTPEGWIRLDEYNNQQVMQVDSNMSGSFVTPLAYVKKQYSGNMVCVRKGGNYTFEATENHNMVYIKSNKEIIKRKACEMPKSIGSAYIPTAINYNGKGISLSNDQIALYLAVSADCTIDIRKGCRYSRFGVKKNRKYNRIKNLLDRLEIKYFDNPNAANGYKYIGFRTPNWIESKELPVNWIYDATLEQRKFILDEMVYWDGNRVPNRNQVEYSTKLYSNAILIQTIAHTCGYMSTIIKRKNLHGEWYKVSILFNKHGVSFQNGFDKEYYYEGMVYCVTVPTGMILIRQEGHVSVTGNCDTLSIIESGYSNVVSTPNGCGNTKWVEYNWDWLEQFDKIILWYDSDEPGIKGRNEVLYRLGTWRTYYIEIPPTETTENGGRIKDANELLYFKGKEKVLEYINKPFEIPVQNVMDLSKAEDFDIEHTEGLYTGIKELDDKIYKLTFGTLNIITGRAGCVDCDTEYFNGTQWKRIADYTKGDRVLQYNMDGTASLVNPIQYHKYQESNLWHLKTKYGLDMCVSDEHNMCYITSKGNICIKSFKDFKFVHDRSINGHQGKFITSFSYSGDGINLSDNEIKLMLAVVCDGTFDKKIQSNRCRVQLKKDRKKIELEKILNDLKIKYSKNNGVDNYSCYVFKAPLRTKEFTEEWYNCNHHQLSIIVNNIYKWDGSSEGTSWRYFTTNKKNADFIQFAASACGYKATVNIEDRRGRIKLLNDKKYITKSIDYTIHATKRNLVGIGVRGRYNKKTEITSYKTLDGYKYCFTVPSHMWIMRRNGKICVTGNSGKSCFVNQVALCQALQQGYDTFVFSGELPAPILRNWIETTMIGRDNITMKDGHIRIFDSAKRKQMQNWYSGRILVYDNDRDSTANSILNKMEELARKCGTKVFLIDNLMMVDLECNEEGRLQAEKNFIGKLINFAKKYNVLVFLVAHPRKTKEAGGRLTQEDIAGSGNIVNLAHMVFSVHRYTEKEKQGETNMKGDFIKGKEPVEYDISIEVLKNRITGVLPTVDMYFDYNSYRFYRTPSELWFRYNWNKDTSPLRTDDPNIHKIEEKSSPF